MFVGSTLPTLSWAFVRTECYSYRESCLLGVWWCSDLQHDSELVHVVAVVSDQQPGQVETVATATHSEKKCGSTADDCRFVLFRHSGRTRGQLFLLMHLGVIKICLFISLYGQNASVHPKIVFRLWSQLCFSVWATFRKQSGSGSYALTVLGWQVSRGSKVPRY